MSEVSFEEKMENIKKILENLNNKDINLQDSIKLYKDGISKIKEAREQLESAKLEIKEIDNG